MSAVPLRAFAMCPVCGADPGETHDPKCSEDSFLERDPLLRSLRLELDRTTNDRWIEMLQTRITTREKLLRQVFAKRKS